MWDYPYYQKSVLWIRNDLFRIRLRIFRVFQVSALSFNCWIRDKVPDLSGSGSTTLVFFWNTRCHEILFLDQAEWGGAGGAAGQAWLPHHLYQRGAGGAGLPAQHGGHQGLVRRAQGPHQPEQDQVSTPPPLGMMPLFYVGSGSDSIIRILLVIISWTTLIIFLIFGIPYVCRKIVFFLTSAYFLQIPIPINPIKICCVLQTSKTNYTELNFNTKFRYFAVTFHFLTDFMIRIRRNGGSEFIQNYIDSNKEFWQE